ncbi:MAG: hypothetical protein Q9213_004551 [Squamulea squamosa]
MTIQPHQQARSFLLLKDYGHCDSTTPIFGSNPGLEAPRTGQGILKQCRWAIRDKQKFASLVEGIHQFINRLEAFTESVEMSTRRRMLIREELITTEHHEDLRLIEEASEGSNEEWSDAASVAFGASVDRLSQNGHIRDWMSTVSDFKKSKHTDHAESEPPLNLLKTDTESRDDHSKLLPPNPLSRKLDK